MSGPTQHQPNRGTLAVWLILLYWIVNEWIFFFYPEDYGGTSLDYLTNFIKLCVPILILVIAGIPSLEFFNRKVAIGLYTLFFLALIVWSTVPTVIYSNLIEVLKKIPRFLFFLAAIALFMKNPGAIRSCAKFIIVIVLFALAQYLSVYLFNATGSGFSVGGAPSLAGPFGIFGNVTSMMFMPGIDLPVIRLAGFWNEPSNASASAFAAFFLSRYLFILDHRSVWRYASYCCLAAGFLCLSNAGYLALAVALLFGAFVVKKKFSMRRFAGLVMITALSLLFVFTALFGRGYVARNYPDNNLLHALVGVHHGHTDYVDQDDEYGGRIYLANMTISAITDNPIGIGLQPVGSGGGIDSSASAPLFWLYLTGIPGLVFLLLRETVLLFSAIYLVKRLPSSIYLVQAWIVVLVQQLSYGSWMNPNYQILAAAVLSMAAGVSMTVHRPKLV
jgi:hypothetical protein